MAILIIDEKDHNYIDIGLDVNIGTNRNGEKLLRIKLIDFKQGTVMADFVLIRNEPAMLLALMDTLVNSNKAPH